MVNIVIITDTVFQMNIVVDGCKNIFLGNMLRNQFMYILLDRLGKSFRIFTELFDNLCQYRIIYMLCDTQFFRIALYKACNVYHHIGKNLNVLFLCLDIYKRNCCILNGICQFSSNLRAGCCQNLSGQSIHNILCQDVMSDSVSECKLFVEFISANLCQIISSGVKEHGVDQAFRALNTQGLTGTNFFVQL